MRSPIFFGVTRSFWAFLAGAALFFQQGEPVVAGLATLLANLWTWLDFLAGQAGARLPELTAPAITRWFMSIGPFVCFLVAMQQRAGAARPYTVKPTRETLK